MLKKELRTIYLQKRKALADEVLAVVSENISRQLFSFFSLYNKKIHIYLPISKNKEIDTYLIIDILLNSNNCRVFTPKICGDNMYQVELTKNSEFATNDFGAKEIINISACQDEMDFVIFPLLYTDNFGNRIGYGKGFYDKFFSKFSKNAIKIGLSIFEPYENISDVKIHDIALDYLVLPTEVLSFERNSLK